MTKIAAILLIGALAGKASAAAQDPIVIIDDQPRIMISLAKYDLARVEDVREIKHRISGAATTICDRTYRGWGYLENVACVKTVISRADAQLETVLSKPGNGLAMTAIAVGAPRR